MRKKLICLVLSALMILPVCFLSSCSERTTEEATSSVVDTASEATITLTMYLMSEQHVCTEAELEQIKADSGETSNEYKTAKAVYDAHEAVETAVNKITKAKFKTQLVLYWLTEDEYYKTVEDKITANAEERLIREEAKSELSKFRKQMRAEGQTDAKVVESLFYEKYPQYAAYTDAVVDEDTAATEAETIRNELGIIELKYPDEQRNQVDIIYLGGYDNYMKYIDNEWLSKLNDELSSSSKAITSYVNSIFLDAMSVERSTYAIPTNKAIGEYTYLLIDKELYSDYQYSLPENIASATAGIQHLADDSVIGFLEDIKEQVDNAVPGSEEASIVPLTGDIGVFNDFYWSIGYEFVEQPGITQFESGKYYYTKNDDGTYLMNAKFYPGMNYYVNDDEKKFYIEQPSLTSLADDVTYYIVNPENYVQATSFVKGVRYYVCDEFNHFTEVKDLEEFAEGVTYYRMSDNCYTQEVSYVSGHVYYTRDSAGNYISAGNITRFVSGRSYFIISNDACIQYDAFDSEKTYYIASFNIERDKFSLLGTVYQKNRTQGGALSISNIFTASSSYSRQLLNLMQLKEDGYYDPDALNDPTKTFAAAVVKGGAELYEKYSDKYELVVLEYPRAYSEDLYDDMFAVSSYTKSLSRSMQIITYLNTNSDFRNLIQYGIEDVNYTVVDNTIDGVSYPTIVRKDRNYLMDLEKTGNTFIAYPEEGMIPNVWYYGKLQNREAKKDMLIDFDLNAQPSLSVDTIDELAALSAEWKAKLDACTTYAELEELLSTAYDEVRALTVMQNEVGNTVNPHSLNAIYTTWYDKLYGEDE